MVWSQGPSGLKRDVSCTGPQPVLERIFQNKNLQNDISNEHKVPLKDVKPVRMENRNQIR